jgi:hypothetical protein
MTWISTILSSWEETDVGVISMIIVNSVIIFSNDVLVKNIKMNSDSYE